MKNKYCRGMEATGRAYGPNSQRVRGRVFEKECGCFHCLCCMPCTCSWILFFTSHTHAKCTSPTLSSTRTTTKSAHNKPENRIITPNIRNIPDIFHTPGRSLARTSKHSQHRNDKWRSRTIRIPRETENLRASEAD